MMKLAENYWWVLEQLVFLQNVCVLFAPKERNLCFFYFVFHGVSRRAIRWARKIPCTNNQASGWTELMHCHNDTAKASWVKSVKENISGSKLLSAFTVL